MRLNLGCGHGRMEGYVNVDIQEAPNVDFVWDLENIPWPDELRGASEIRACHVFEHIDRFDLFWSELAQCLQPGGRVHAWVPYGIQQWKKNPFHAHPWYPDSVRALCRGDHGTSCLLGTDRNFDLIRMTVRGHGFPWWHLEHYLGWVAPAPWPWVREIEFLVRKAGGP